MQKSRIWSIGTGFYGTLIGIRGIFAIPDEADNLVANTEVFRSNKESE